MKRQRKSTCGKNKHQRWPVPGNKEFTVIDVVTAECVYGMNIFRDAFAAFRDVVGGRNDASEKVLKDLKQTCLTELEEALKSVLKQ